MLSLKINHEGHQVWHKGLKGKLYTTQPFKFFQLHFVHFVPNLVSFVVKISRNFLIFVFQNA